MDKARRLYPLAITFGDGEQPSASKLSGISTQAKNALGIVEFMIGDIWNQAGDVLLSPSGTPTVNALHIPNLARSIGKMSLLNSMIPGTSNPLSSSMIYNDDVGATYVGKNRGILKYKPAVTPSSVNMILAGTFAPLVQGQFTTNPTATNVSGDWSVDADGKLYTYDPIPSTLILQYVPTVTSDTSNLNGPSSSWNVIPDPTTWSGNYAGVKISLANNVDTTLGYHIWLPPRKPLSNDKLIRKSPTTTNNISATPNSGSLLFFQDDTAVASTTNADHYRYNFPVEITNTGGSGNTIPTGFVYIWDETTGTIVDGVTFFVPGTAADRKFKIRATGVNLVSVFGSTIGNGIITDDTTQLAADYKIRFKIITIGSSLAKEVSYLNKNFWNHKHKSSEGHPAIDHADLDNLVTPGWDLTYNPVYASGIKSFNKSAWQNDDHPQYVHRAGSTMNANERDRHDNSVLRMLSVKSPLTTDFQGRINLSVNDPGNLAHINATEFTNLIIGGTAWPVNLDNVQVNKRLYFSDTGSPSYANSDDYITFDDSTNTFSFFADGTSGNVVADSVSGATIVAAPTVQGNNIIAAGDTSPSPSDRIGSFKYNPSFPRYQYFHIAPESIILSAADQAAGLTFSPLNDYIFNNDTSNTFNIFIPIRFPHGATVTTSENIRVWASGNGTSGLQISMIFASKATTNGWTSLSTGTIISTTNLGIAATNAITNIPYGSTFSLDNGFLGATCFLVVAFPVKISSNTPKLWGVTLQYRIFEVDN